MLSHFRLWMPDAAEHDLELLRQYYVLLRKIAYNAVAKPVPAGIGVGNDRRCRIAFGETREQFGNIGSAHAI